jgi:hypothetical protein
MRRRSDRGAGGVPRHDPYQLLAVGPDATVEQINAAYRKALRRQHPDTRTVSEPTPRDPTMADLQAARAQLLRRARARLNRESTAPAPPEPEPRVAPRSRTTASDQSVPASRAVPVSRPRRGWAVRLDGIDIVVGPVRYHGPAPRRSP